jgi:hypothetical protein
MSYGTACAGTRCHRGLHRAVEFPGPLAHWTAISLGLDRALLETWYRPLSGLVRRSARRGLPSHTVRRACPALGLFWVSHPSLSFESNGLSNTRWSPRARLAPKSGSYVFDKHNAIVEHTEAHKGGVRLARRRSWRVELNSYVVKGANEAGLPRSFDKPSIRLPCSPQRHAAVVFDDRHEIDERTQCRHRNFHKCYAHFAYRASALSSMSVVGCHVEIRRHNGNTERFQCEPGTSITVGRSWRERTGATNGSGSD